MSSGRQAPRAFHLHADPDRVCILHCNIDKYTRPQPDIRKGCANKYLCVCLTPRLGLKPIPVPTPDGCVDRLCGKKDVPGSMMFGDDIMLYGDDETNITAYLETWR